MRRAELGVVRFLVAVRDSKDPEGPELIFGLEEWRTFTGARFSVHISHRQPLAVPRRSAEARPPQALVSVLVSFTPVRGGSPATTAVCLRWSGTLTDGGGRWCTVLESV